MVSKRKSLSILFTTIILLSGLPYASAAGQLPSGSSIKDVSPQPIVSSNRDGSKTLEQLSDHIKQLGAYKFDGTLSTLKEKGLSVDCGTFFFMPLTLLRVEVKNGGYKSGSVLVKQKDGRIRAKGGRALLGMKITLEPDSNMLRLPNGLNIVECDLVSLLQWLKKEIATGQKIYSSDGPIQIDSQSGKVLVLETREAKAGSVMHRIMVDPQQLVPVEWQMFKEGRAFSSVRFNNFQLCPSLDDSMFKL